MELCQPPGGADRLAAGWSSPRKGRPYDALGGTGCRTLQYGRSECCPRGSLHVGHREAARVRTRATMSRKMEIVVAAFEIRRSDPDDIVNSFGGGETHGVLRAPGRGP